MTKTPTIHVFESLPFWGRGHSETCYNICAPWAEMGQKVIVNTTLAPRPDPAGILHPQIPRWLPKRIQRLLYEWLGRDRLKRRAEASGVARIEPGDICYFWPASSYDTIQRAKEHGAILAIEFVNTHVENRHKLLTEAASERSLAIPENLTSKFKAEEKRIAIADIAFAPGPFVGESIRANSTSLPQILETSYGARIPPSAAGRDSRQGPLRFLFVGKFSLGKGALDLLDGWRLANLDAELAIAGNVDPQISPFLNDAEDCGIKHLGFQPNIATVYQEADVFVFPSHDEGGPQVCYEAAAHGLPMIVTPMGGGRIANDTNSIIVPRRDPAALADAMKRMFADAELRRDLGTSARMAASDYDWRKVSASRLAQLLQAAKHIDR